MFWFYLFTWVKDSKKNWSDLNKRGEVMKKNCESVEKESRKEGKHWANKWVFEGLGIWLQDVRKKICLFPLYNEDGAVWEALEPFLTIYHFEAFINIKTKY